MLKLDNGSPPLTTSTSISITVIDMPDEPPIFDYAYYYSEVTSPDVSFKPNEHYPNLSFSSPSYQVSSTPNQHYPNLSFSSTSHQASSTPITIGPDPINAQDGDVEINSPITYTMTDARTDGEDNFSHPVIHPHSFSSTFPPCPLSSPLPHSHHPPSIPSLSPPLPLNHHPPSLPSLSSSLPLFHHPLSLPSPLPHSHHPPSFLPFLHHFHTLIIHFLMLLSFTFPSCTSSPWTPLSPPIPFITFSTLPTSILPFFTTSTPPTPTLPSIPFLHHFHTPITHPLFTISPLPTPTLPSIPFFTISTSLPTPTLSSIPFFTTSTPPTSTLSSITFFTISTPLTSTLFSFPFFTTSTLPTPTIFPSLSSPLPHSIIHLLMQHLSLAFHPLLPHSGLYFLIPSLSSPSPHSQHPPSLPSLFFTISTPLTSTLFSFPFFTTSTLPTPTLSSIPFFTISTLPTPTLPSIPFFTTSTLPSCTIPFFTISTLPTSTVLMQYSSLSAFPIHTVSGTDYFDMDPNTAMVTLTQELDQAILDFETVTFIVTVSNSGLWMGGINA
ncbi:hypothetical protein Pcinc_032662 [Petrolisthes cinctipes]|uniref:Cadherin domain-containing protein n=1 Tax=Petrolisthes cinctipes TaxID=88211 RepID=A0AAE1ETN6_PETCI|nr:hypothetical protein Pcinc_032662 [Petrolisthes cinctipes]